MKTKLLSRFVTAVVLLMIFCFSNFNIKAQNDKSFEVYGFTMAEAGYNFKTINPDYYDALRVTRLPSFKGEFAPDGKLFYSVRQSRFGVKSTVPTGLGDLKTVFEFDLYGVGADAGQTTIRPRQIYGQLGKFLAGQTNSTFMDIDVFPNSLEYWGPTGMIFYRNIQLRYTPIMTKQDNLAMALEQPGASGDGGIYSNRVELTNVKPLFNVPDFTAHYRYTGNFGYIQLGGIVGSIKWRDVSDTARFQLNGSAVRWGGTLSSNINIGKKAIFKIQGVYGEGMQNYMNDAPVDIGIQSNPGDSLQPFKGKALPVWGITAFMDVNWSKLFSSSFGYSVETIDNSDLQTPNAYKQGQYGLVNLLYYPVENVMAGVEYNFGRRDNFSDGFHSTTSEVRFAFKYNFSQIWKF
ncbi:MAG TPA: DcaP family trimeric outer membrane transporter [Ignavibacteria bacterium]|nr:DcaP family trimeric outer membrane transporter [Ignavibacteria bacterium]HQY51509.1 DcaP family trimeric outer membrane transporter [Ignavibacteria bacterium]HRB01440.1 DcaP family trimeric outer membrane transporter [Ignavibacteria bacterium]